MTDKNIYSNSNFHAVAHSSRTGIQNFMKTRERLTGEINELDTEIQNYRDALSSSKSNLEILNDLRGKITQIEEEEPGVI